MLGKHELKKLSETYEASSWAVWSEEFPAKGSVEHKTWEENVTNAIYDMIIENAANLSQDIILMGLNPSGTLSGPFSNFHSPSGRHNDPYLKETIQDRMLANVHGAYMTDLLKGENTPDAHATGDLNEVQLAKFKEELSLLGQSEYDVICFGKSKFERILRGAFDNEFERIDTVSPPILRLETEVNDKVTTFYVVYHYIRTHKNRMARQLEFLNEEVLE